MKPPRIYVDDILDAVRPGGSTGNISAKEGSPDYPIASAIILELGADRHFSPESVLREKMASIAAAEGLTKPAVHKLTAAEFRDMDRPLEPLTDQQQEVFNYIRAHPGSPGKTIVRECALESESVFTTHYVPALKRHGIRNKRGYGYYLGLTK